MREQLNAMQAGNTDDAQKKWKHCRGRYLVAGTVVLFFAGIVYAWSNISAPLASLGWSETELAFTYTLSFWFVCAGQIISGLLDRALSVRTKLLVSAAMMFAGFLLCTRLRPGQSLLPLYVGYGVLAGCGVGVVYNTVVVTLTGWFPDRKGFCTGVLMMGFGSGAFVIGLIAAALLKDGAFAWQTVYCMLAVAMGAVTACGALLIRKPDAARVNAMASSVTADSLYGRSFTTGEMVRSWTFWRMYLYLLLLTCVGLTSVGFARNYLLSIAVRVDTAVLFAALISIANSAGRLLSGLLLDSLRLYRTRLIASGIVILATLCCLVAALTGLPALGIGGLMLCGFSYGFSPTISAVFLTERYGSKHFALNSSLMNFFCGIPCALVPTLVSDIVTRSAGRYGAALLLLLALSLVGLAFNLSVKDAETMPVLTE